MLRWLAVLTLVPTLSWAAPKKAPAPPPPTPSVRSFMEVRVPSSPTLAPDGSVFVRDWPDGIPQLYVRAPGAAVDAPMRKLTDYADGLSGYSLSPGGKAVIVWASVGGNEDTAISLLDVANGTRKELLSGAGIQYSPQLWVDDTAFVFRTNEANGKDFHLVRYDLGTGEKKVLLAKEGDWSAVDMSADGSRMLVVHTKSASDSRSYEVQIASGELVDLSATAPQTPSVSNVQGYVAGDGEVLLVSDVGDGVRRLYRRSLSGEPRFIEALPLHHDVEIDGVAIDREGRWAITAHNEKGYSKLRAYKLPKLQEVPLPKFAAGTPYVADLRGDTLVVGQVGPRDPGVSVAVTLGSAKARPITTRADQEPVDLTRLVEPKLVEYPGADGQKVPAFLFMPPDAKGPIPFVVQFHGGPEGQWRPGFDRTAQMLVANGFGVLQPNVRGSTGYGRKWQQADDYKGRWDSVRDGVEAARWLVAQGMAEPGQIGGMGGSYGGFMAVATAIEGADVFGAFIDVVGIVNFETFLEQTRSYRRALREVEYGPLTDRDFLRSVSPIHLVDKIKAPALIAHGLNDPRVPVGEAMQLALALQARGMEPVQLYFPDEGHGFAKLENRVLYAERALAFLQKNLIPPPPPPPPHVCPVPEPCPACPEDVCPDRKSVG